MRLFSSNRVRAQCRNKDILTVEDVVSVLPRHRVTNTALYKVLEVFHIRNEYATLIPPSLLLRWYENRHDEVVRRNLIDCLEPAKMAHLKTVFIFPPLFETVEALAICSLTLGYCSTMLVGTTDATKKTKNFLRDLFKSISCWPSEFSWERFHHVPIYVGGEKGQGRWSCINSQDIGITVAGVALDIAFAGCRGLGEILGLGGISEECPKVSTVRHHCLNCLTSSVLPGLN
jgi:hypothetical protein